MIADLIAVGIFSAARYDTPNDRTIDLRLARGDMLLPDKYADELLDYRIDWTARLGNDSVAGFAVSRAAGDIAISRSIYDGTTTSFWVGSGSSGTASTIKCLATTSGGRVLEQVLTIRCI